MALDLAHGYDFDPRTRRCRGCGMPEDTYRNFVRGNRDMGTRGDHQAASYDRGDHVCQHGTALDVHCCNCHSGFIFDKDHVCPDPAVLSLHRCKICGTRWLLWPDAVHGGGWNLLDRYSKPGGCCDNVAMGDQIEHLRDIPLSFTAPPAAPQQCAEHHIACFQEWLCPVCIESWTEKESAPPAAPPPWQRIEDTAARLGLVRQVEPLPSPPASTRPFSELREQMSPEAQQRAKDRADEILAASPPASAPQPTTTTNDDDHTRVDGK